MPDAKTTQMQELASTWIIKRGIGPSPVKKYQTVEELKKDKAGYTQLLKIYPDVNKKWLEGLVAQQKTVIRELLGGGHYTTFNRDGGFMDFISKLVKNKFKIAKKDSWNPADIWVIRNETVVISQINQAVSGSAATITELNEIMKKLWKQKALKGISLKAISGDVAKWETVNLNDALFEESNKPPVFDLASIKCSLDMTNNEFTSSDSIIIVKEGTTEYHFQIRQNSRGFNNLKFEPSKKGAGAARLGKVPLNLLKKMMKNDYKLTFNNNHNEYPKDEDGWTKNEYKKYRNIWKNLKTNPLVKTNITTEDKFKNSFSLAFKDETTEKESQRPIATSKLMQLDFISQVLSLKKEQYNELFTNMVFLAQKKGAGFGPFAKLY